MSKIITMDKSTCTTGLSRIIRLEKYSSLNRLLLVTSFVLRFIKRCRKSQGLSLIGDEKEEALNKWIIQVQRDYYNDEMCSLKSTGAKKNSLTRQLNLFIDKEGILRCKGRLSNLDVDAEAKNPIILHQASWFTKLVVLQAHQNVFHGRVRATLAEVRQKYWIVHGRRVVKSVLRKCVQCIKLDGAPFQGPEPPDLPKSRVTEGLPFQFTGVDLAGPVYTRMKDGTGVKYQKMYICLYTCAVVRAVHLEVVEHQTVSSFLQSFRRFISRRGIPEIVFSDNAKNFKGASEELKNYTSSIITTAESQKFLFNKGIRWYFIVERAPWWGGFYERLIGTVKRCLRKVFLEKPFWNF